MKIENNHLLIEVNPRGGALSRIYDKDGKKEILYDGKGSWPNTDLILFPVIGANNLYSLGESNFHLPLKHGFAQSSFFSIKQETKGSLTLSLEEDGTSQKEYPFSFLLKLSYLLEERKLIRKTEIMGEDLIFQFGLHPAFRADFSSAFVEVKQGTNLFVLDKKDGIIKKEIPWPYPLKWKIERKDIVSQDTFVISNPSGSVFFSNGMGSSVHLTSRCPYFALWTPERETDDDFLCLESWYGISPYAGMPMDLRKRKNVNRCNGLSAFEDILDF